MPETSPDRATTHCYACGQPFDNSRLTELLAKLFTTNLTEAEIDEMNAIPDHQECYQ